MAGHTWGIDFEWRWNARRHNAQVLEAIVQNYIWIGKKRQFWTWWGRISVDRSHLIKV